jgi:DNA-directed RNA polymerase specialized sigma24 family protein
MDPVQQHLTFGTELRQRTARALDMPRLDLREAFLSGVAAALQNLDNLAQLFASFAPPSGPDSLAVAEGIVDSIRTGLLAFARSRDAARAYPDVDRVKVVEHALSGGKIAAAQLPPPLLDRQLLAELADEKLRRQLIGQIRYACRCEPDTAADIYQGAYYRAIFKLSLGHHATSNPKGWFWRLTLNHAIDFLEKRAVQRQTEEGVDDPGQLPARAGGPERPLIDRETDSRRQQLPLLLDQIVLDIKKIAGPKAAEVWDAVRRHGAPEDELARKQKVHKRTVRNRLYKADAIARRRLEDDGFAP